MKNKPWIIVLILVVLIVAVTLFYNSSKSVVNTQECFNKEGYCVYDNIPAGMRYTSPDEEIPENFIADRQLVLNEYLKRTASEGKSINEGFGLDPNKYVCSNGDKIVIVNYFYDLCEWAEGMEGCGYERKAIVCGDNYYIEQYRDATGPVMYGPFQKEIIDY